MRLSMWLRCVVLVCLMVGGIHGVSRHTNNWAVLVCTSRFWFNYRHVANTLSFYHTVKRHGIPDSNIILMLADDMPCNPRNNRAGHVQGSVQLRDIYGSDVEVDFRGEEVTVENFIRVMTGRQHAHTPPSKRLLTDANSNILVYLTGHGGDEFLKFQDSEEIGAQDFADAIEQMRIQGRYNEMLFVTDTCQAATLSKRLYSKNVIAVGSSLKGQNSFSHSHDNALGVSIIDRFSHATGAFFQEHSRNTNVQLSKLFARYRSSAGELLSDVGIRLDLMQRPMSDVKLWDFFGSVQQTETLGPVRNLDIVRELDDTAKNLSSLGLHVARDLQAEDMAFATKVELGTHGIHVNKETLLGLGLFAVVVTWLACTT